jgi:hypothetical protein
MVGGSNTDPQHLLVSVTKIYVSGICVRIRIQIKIIRVRNSAGNICGTTVFVVSVVHKERPTPAKVARYSENNLCT